MNDRSICKTCIWYDDLACMNNKEICVDNSAYTSEKDVIHDICAEESNQIRRDNTIKAIMELCTLYYNSNFVSRRITEYNTRIEGYTRHSFSELKDSIAVIRSRYGYYCDISFTYDPCQMFLAIEAKERGVTRE